MQLTTTNTAMLFAAGLGTRLKPFTNNHPKALAQVNGKTLLQRNIQYLQQFDINNVVVNVHHFASQIIDIVDKNNGWGSQIIISDETDEVLETGGGLKKAIPLFDDAENVVVMNVDILTNLNINKMFEQHIAANALATLAVTTRETSRYFIFDLNNKLCGWTNTKTNEIKGTDKFNSAIHKKLAFSGIHIINKKLFALMQQQGKFSMVDVYLDLTKTNEIIAFDHSNDKFIDVGKPESITDAEVMFG
ncbi:MAG: nucleotidyltransferase family protein [Chitinophagaceae bacterium]